MEGTPAVETSLVDVTEELSRHQRMPCRVMFKLESEQPSGSFKLRGIGHLVAVNIRRARATASKPIQVFALSGGNAGMAAAYAARYFAVKCTVVVPSSASPAVVAALRELGSTVVLHGNSIQDADVLARQIMADSSEYHGIYCHPFDHPDIWQGHSYMVDEMLSQLGPEKHRLRGVVCSVGGGGLYYGIRTGLARNGSRADCVLVETRQAPTLGAAVRAGLVVTLEKVRLLATSLACLFVSEDTLCKFLGDSRSHLVEIDDKDAVRGSVAYYRDFGRCVEPACGAALSVVYGQLEQLKSAVELSQDDIVVVVVCGGVCAGEEELRQYAAMLRELKM